MHTLKTVPISLCRQTYFETINFYRRSTDLFMLVFQRSFQQICVFVLLALYESADDHDKSAKYLKQSQ